jgi:hypothetical protein
MAIITNDPVVNDEGTYDKYGINLAVSPMWKEDSIGISVAMRLTPYRYNAEGLIEKRDEDARAVVYGDATADMQNDPVLAKCVADITQALQEFITGKGI